MRSALFVIIAALLAGCATAPDPIDHLVADLSSTHGFWVNGLGMNVKLPKTASPEQVVEQVFQTATFEKGRVTSYKFLKVRQVHIQFYSPESYTAALVQTNFGEKIVLFKYEEDFGSWWNRVYDANRTYFKKKSA
jgi:type IV pilus biogenesis protein CpaD/CtpE